MIKILNQQKQKIKQSAKYKKYCAIQFVKGYGFLSFAKNMGKNIGQNISKNLSGKYSLSITAMRQNIVDHAKQSATDAFKAASKRAIQKTAEAAGDLIDNKIGSKITKAPKNLQENNSETVTNETDKESLKREIYISRKNTRNY